MKFLLFFTSFLFTLGFLHAENQPSRSILDEKGQAIVKLSFQDGQLITRTLFSYDAKGRVIKKIADNGLSEDPLNLEGVTERYVTLFKYHPRFSGTDYLTEVLHKFISVEKGTEKIIWHIFNTFSSDKKLIQREEIDSEGTYTHITFDDKGKFLTFLKCQKSGEQERMVFSYDKDGRLQSVAKETREGITELIYDIHGFPIIRKEDPKHENTWIPAVAESIEFYQQVFTNMQKAMERISFSTIDFSRFKCVDEHLENFTKGLIGPLNFTLSGYYQHPARSGIYGNGEFDDKVRVTLINGILNNPKNHLENLDRFSSLHGGVNIHYVFRPFGGYSRDVMRSVFTKLGWVSPQARDLAKMWKDLIAEMGGLEGKGHIIHYAHSLGGTDTNRAKDLMTKEELQMISCYTFGSPTIIVNGHFKTAINYTSLRDGVSQFFDPLTYVWGLFTTTSNIVYLDTIWGVPFIDHLISNPSYNQVLKQRGKDFIKAYFKKEANSPLEPSPST